MRTLKRPRIFISYAREDRELALQVYQDLEAAGMSPWIDVKDLQGGLQWKSAITTALRDASRCVVMLSHSSVSKIGYVQKEVREALEILSEYPPDKIFVVPVRLDNVVPTHQQLQDINWIDLFPDYQSGMQRLIASLHDSPAVVAPPTLERYLAVRQRRARRGDLGRVPPPRGGDFSEVYGRVYERAEPIAESLGILLFPNGHPEDCWVGVAQSELENAIFDLTFNAIKFAAATATSDRPWSGMCAIQLKKVRNTAHFSLSSYGRIPGDTNLRPRNLVRTVAHRPTRNPVLRSVIRHLDLLSLGERLHPFGAVFMLEAGHAVTPEPVFLTYTRVILSLPLARAEPA